MANKGKQIKKNDEIAIKLSEITESIKQLNLSRNPTHAYIAMLISIIAVSISLVSLFLVAAPASPKVLYWVDSYSDYQNCLPNLDFDGRQYKTGFTNIGKNPTRLELYIKGENVQINNRGNVQHSAEYPFNNTLSFSPTILPYDAQPSLTHTIAIRIMDTSVDKASFEVGYYYNTYFLRLIPLDNYRKNNKIAKCIYLKNPNGKYWELIE